MSSFQGMGSGEALEQPHFLQSSEGKTPETTSSLTEQILRILEERIENKINWDHERLILSWETLDNHRYQLLPSVEIPSPPFHDELKLLEEPIDLQNSLGNQEQQEMQGEPLISINSEKPEEEGGKKDEKKKHKGCTCKKSFCLKLYCECFRNGKACQDCGCICCKNKEVDHQERKEAVKNIISRQPTAFNENFKYKGCRCTKSQCVKGYCECFMDGHTCGKYCKCLSCLNRPKTNKSRKASDSSTIPEAEIV